MSQGEPSVIDIPESQQGEPQNLYQGEPRYINLSYGIHTECMMVCILFSICILFITLLIFVLLMNAELMTLEKQNNNKNVVECDKWKSANGCTYLNWSTSGDWQIAVVATTTPALFGVYMCKNINCRIPFAKICYYHVNDIHTFYKHKKCVGSSNKYNILAMCTLGFSIALFTTICIGNPGHGTLRKIRNVSCIFNFIALIIISIVTIIVYFRHSELNLF